MKIPKSFIPKKDLEEVTKELLKGKPKKKEDEPPEKIIYKSIEYKGLTFREFLKCNYPKKKLKSMKVTFEYKNRSFKAVHEALKPKGTQVYLTMQTKNSGPNFLDKTVLKLALKKYKSYYEPGYYKPINLFLKKPFVEDLGTVNKNGMQSEYHRRINIPDLVFCVLDLSTDVKGFYQKKFKNLCLYATYHTISVQDYDYSNLPEKKVNESIKTSSSEKTK